MTDPTLEEVYEYLMHSHQIVFAYKDKMYSIEPVIEDYPDHKFLNVWLCDELHPQHLVHLEVPSLCDVPKTAIDKILTGKWIIGNKSFMEVMDEIVVTEIG